VPQERYCDEWAEMACELAERCDCLGGYGVELCITYARMDCADEIEAPVQSGRVTYDAHAAGRCLSASYDIARDCSLEGARWPDACDQMLTGAVPQGGYCEGDQECISPLECYDDACVALPQAGQACHPEYSCAMDLYCGSSGLCETYKPQGQSCADAYCDDDLYCDSRTDTCQPYLGTGQDCSYDTYACDDDLYCESATQTCRPYPSWGQPCADPYEDCADDLYCDSDKVCRPQGQGGARCSDSRECLSWECNGEVCEPDENDICDFSF